MSKSVKHTQTQLVENTTETDKQLGDVNETSPNVVDEDPLAVETPAPVEVKPKTPPANDKPKIGFGIVEKLKPEETHTPPPPNSELHKLIKDKHGIDYNSEELSSPIRTMMDDLDNYAKVMHPHAPVTDKVVETQQNILIRRINDALADNPQMGVPRLLVIEEYFKYHIGGAFGGILPFRGFNMISPKLQPFQDIVYVLQRIAELGKSGAMAEIDVTKLKQACPTADAQVVLLAYLNV